MAQVSLLTRKRGKARLSLPVMAPPRFHGLGILYHSRGRGDTLFPCEESGRVPRAEQVGTALEAISKLSQLPPQKKLRGPQGLPARGAGSPPACRRQASLRKAPGIGRLSRHGSFDSAPLEFLGAGRTSEAVPFRLRPIARF